VVKDEKKKLISVYKEKARVKYRRLVTARKKRRGLPVKEQFTLWKKDHQSLKKWKVQIKKVENTTEHKAQKKGYKLYKKLLRRKYVIATWIAVVVVLISLFGSWYYGATRPLTADQQQARDRSLKVAREVMDEGIVLLRNENGVLPLSSKKVSVFGTAAASPVYGGGGAGGIAAKDVESLYTAFDASDIEYDKTLYNLYSNYAFSDKASTEEYTPPTSNSLIDTLLPNVAGFLAGSEKEMPIDKIPEAVVDGAKKHADTALYMISRAGMETVDFKTEELRLTKDERATLRLIDDNFAHVVVLLNTTNAFEAGFVNEFKNIDGLLWVGAPGEVGSYSIAKTLTGEVNPSGKLTDTYVYDLGSNPAVLNTGNFQYKENGEGVRRYFMNELENIYVGYRYYETFVDDAKYDSVVQYPFGHGLSYTDFDWKLASSQANENQITAQVIVTNTGNTAGKEVVQVYYEPPFTQGGIEKSAIVLGGYAKTKLLQPGESEMVTVSDRRHGILRRCKRENMGS